MSWLLDLLVDAVKEMVSQFIIDMMGLITDVFTDLLSCNLSLFEELFSVVGSLYQNVIVYGNCAVAYDSNLAAVQIHVREGWNKCRRTNRVNWTFFHLLVLCGCLKACY